MGRPPMQKSVTNGLGIKKGCVTKNHESQGGRYGGSYAVGLAQTFKKICASGYSIHHS